MKTNKYTGTIYKNFPGHDRFSYPEYIERVTAGGGGEALMIFTEGRTSLYDCGMAYCHDNLIMNIKEALSERKRDTLDYIFLSHSHYDHIGALPYILKEWPDAVVFGAEKIKSVFKSEGARKTMKRLGEQARDNFNAGNEPVLVEGFRIDRTLKDGDRVDLGGGSYFYVMETKGHTDCSLTYVLEPQSIMFASESTGVLRAPGLVHTAILKGYDKSIDSAVRCRNYGAKSIILPHYGSIPDEEAEVYFDKYIEAAEEEKAFILSWARKGLSNDEIMTKVEEKYWTPERGTAQPKAAFFENAKYTIKDITETFL